VAVEPNGGLRFQSILAPHHPLRPLWYRGSGENTDRLTSGKWRGRGASADRATHFDRLAPWLLIARRRTIPRRLHLFQAQSVAVHRGYIARGAVSIGSDWIGQDPAEGLIPRQSLLLRQRFDFAKPHRNRLIGLMHRSG
jgi:hypothetical protein